MDLGAPAIDPLHPNLMQDRLISAEVVLEKPNRPSVTRHIHGLKALNACMIFLESLVLVRSWIENVPTYLFLPFYMQGKERMPYQGRFLMMFPMRWAAGSCRIHRLSSHFGSHKLGDPVYMGIFLVSVPALLVAMYCITLIYLRFSRNGKLAWLVPWICIYAVQSTYVVRYSQSFMYPYDFASLAFFAAGVFFIAERKFILFTLVFLIGTLNRETTLLLLAILLVELYRSNSGKEISLWSRIEPILSTGLLAASWLAIRLLVRHHFHSVRSEENSHLQNNVLFLRHVQDWPELASTCGFLWLVPISPWLKSWHLMAERAGVWV